MKNYYVYIITNKKNGTIYTGVTNDIRRRMHEHKGKYIDGFSKKYELDILVFLESFNNINDALENEKKIKGWSRDKKIALIERLNPDWKEIDLDPSYAQDDKGIKGE